MLRVSPDAHALIAHGTAMGVEIRAAIGDRRCPPARATTDDAARVRIPHQWLERAVVNPAKGPGERHHTGVERDRVEGGGTVTEIAALSGARAW
jgi:hypothetical protein